MSQTSAAGSGLGLGSVWFVTFLVLKLTNVIDWSWWWVTAPLWGPFALILAIFAVVFVFVLLRSLCK